MRPAWSESLSTLSRYHWDKKRQWANSPRGCAPKASSCSTVRVAPATAITGVCGSIRKVIGLRSPLEPVRAWRRAGAAREEPGEVRRIGEAAGLGDQRDAHIRVEQAALGLQQSARIQQC